MSPLEKLIRVVTVILESLEHNVIDYQLARQKQEEAFLDYAKALRELSDSVPSSPR